MKHLLNSAIGRLRIVGIAEGISLLVLLGIAMPLKYMANIPEAVKVVGWIHGILFVLFITMVLMMHQEKHWTIKKTALAIIASFLPFGTFVFDRQLKKEESQSMEINP